MFKLWCEWGSSQVLGATLRYVIGMRFKAADLLLSKFVIIIIRGCCFIPMKVNVRKNNFHIHL